MNEERRGEDFNEIVSTTKKLFEKYNSCSMEVEERKYKYSFKEKPFLAPDVDHDEATITLKFSF